MAETDKLNVIIVALGTMGDLNPLLQIGVKLRALGNKVTILTDATKEPFVCKCGLEYHCVLSEQEWQSFIGHSGLWDRLTSDAIVYRHLMLPTVLPIVSFVEEAILESKTLLVGDVKTLGLRIANEKFNVPLVNIHLAPEYSNSFGEFENQSHEITVLKQLNHLRARFGLLEPVRELTMNWAAKCNLRINAYPQWFHGISNTEYANSEWFDFIFDEQAGEALPDDVDIFIKGGAAPVVFTLGTGLGIVDRFFKAAGEVCNLLNLRAIFLCKEAVHIPQRLPDSVLVKKYLPMSQLLKRCRAIVHHGGVGTTAQAFRAGLPQIVMPMAFDQFGNAVRVSDLKTGFTLPMHQLDASQLKLTLEKLLGDEMIAQQCHRLAASFQGNAAAEAIAKRITTLGKTAKFEPASELLDVDFI